MSLDADEPVDGFEKSDGSMADWPGWRRTACGGTAYGQSGMHATMMEMSNVACTGVIHGWCVKGTKIAHVTL